MAGFGMLENRSNVLSKLYDELLSLACANEWGWKVWVETWTYKFIILRWLIAPGHNKWQLSISKSQNLFTWNSPILTKKFWLLEIDNCQLLRLHYVGERKKLIELCFISLTRVEKSPHKVARSILLCLWFWRILLLNGYDVGRWIGELGGSVIRGWCQSS